MAEASKIGIVIQARLDEQASLTTIKKQLESIQGKLKNIGLDVKFNFDDSVVAKINKEVENTAKKQEQQQKKLTNQRLSDEQKIAAAQQRNAEKNAAAQIKAIATARKAAESWKSGSYDVPELNRLYERDYKNQVKSFQQRQANEEKIASQREKIINRLYQKDYQNQVRTYQLRYKNEISIAQIREKEMLAAEQKIAQFRRKYADVGYDEAELRRILDIEERINKARQQEGNLTQNVRQQISLMRREMSMFEDSVRATQTQMRATSAAAERELAITRQIERARLDANNLMSRFQTRYSGVNYDEAELRRILNIEERINLARRQGGNIQANISHQIQMMRREMTQFENAVRATQAQMRGLNAQSVSLLGSIKRFVQFYVVGDIFMQAERAVRSMYTTVRDLDTAMVEVKKVTKETEEAYARFLDRAAETSAKIGTTTKDFVNAAAEFARTGKTLAESQELAETAVIYTKVSQNLTGADAAQVLVSTMAAFADQGLKSIDIIDKLNNVSNKYSISNEGLGEALKRSASAMREANNTLDETIALITAANTISQDPEMVGVF